MTDTPASRPTASGFIELRERAVELLRSHPEGLDDAALAGELFGAGDGNRWALLLDTVLGADSRLDHRDGRWRFAGRGPGPTSARPELGSHRDAVAAPTEPSAAPSDEIVALALATTGADPRRHRVVGIGVVRRVGGEVVARLDLTIGIGRRLPGYVREASRIGDEELETAPPFADVVPALREAVEGRRVHVYGAHRVRDFIDAELRRVDEPALTADFIEIDRLMRALLPEARKPGLTAAADELGLPRVAGASPLADASLSARIVERLHERQAGSPSRAIVDGPTFDAETTERPLPFTREWLRDVPNGPGVYLILDAEGRVLYVGKAVDLYRRLAAYVSKQPSQHRQLEALGVRAASVETIPTRSDLEATLLEARLIRERRPELNVARETRGPTTVIRAAPDETSPRVQLVAESKPDGARYFGPFESVSAARQALAAARAAYPDAFLRRRGDSETQRRAVLAVCRLLSGQKGPTLDALRLAMQEGAERGDRPEVDRLRAALKGVQDLLVYPSPLAGLEAGWRLLVLERLPIGATVTHLIEEGRLRRSVAWQMSALSVEPGRLRRLAREIEQAPPDDDEIDGCDEPGASMRANDPDEPAIVLRWLTLARSRIEIERVPSATVDDGD